MTFLALVRLFWQMLIRRKSLWVVITLAGIALLINFYAISQMNAMLESGVRYDIATRRASALLDGYAQQIRGSSLILAVLVGALVAPGSRKDGTTQFVLTLSVSRFKLALAQFTALALFGLMSVAVIHAGMMVAAYRVNHLVWSDALLGWIPFYLTLLATSAVSFSLSLTRSALVVYGLLFGIPHVAVNLVLEWAATWKQATVPETLRMAVARTADNVLLMFPDFEELLAWPQVFPALPERPPFPAVGLELAHAACVVVFWVVLGYWAYQRHDFGSRTPTK